MSIQRARYARYVRCARCRHFGRRRRRDRAGAHRRAHGCRLRGRYRRLAGWLLFRSGRYRVRMRHDIGWTQFGRRQLAIHAPGRRCTSDTGPQLADLTAQHDDLALELLDARGQFAGWAVSRVVQIVGRHRFGRGFVRDAWGPLLQQTGERNATHPTHQCTESDRKIVRHGGHDPDHRADHGKYHAHRVPLLLSSAARSVCCTD